MEKPYFIMAYSQNGEFAMPIVESGDDDYDSDVAFYATEKEARDVAKDQIICQSFGYEIFKMGDGE